MPQTADSFSTSESLIRRVQARDPIAWHRLSHLYGPLAYRWARKWGLQPQDSADVVQNVFLSVSQNIARYSHLRPDATFRGWLWTITRNAVREYYRRKTMYPNAIGGSEAYHRLQQIVDQLERSGAAPDDADEVNTSTALAHRALRLIQGDFDLKTWDAFRRMTMENQSAAEVGRDLGMTSRAVRQAKYRVLCRLREMLADE